MRLTNRVSPLWALIGVCLLAQAQGSDFPASAATPSASEIERHIKGKVFSVALADGSSWRVEFNSVGYFFVDTSRGGRAEGSWRTEDGRLCSHVRGRDPTCNDARWHDGKLMLKRASGEIITYEPR